MSTIFILLAILLACLIAVGSIIDYRMRRCLPFVKPLPVKQSSLRQLTAEERIAVEHYLAQENRQKTTPLAPYALPQTTPFTAKQSGISADSYHYALRPEH